MREKSKKKAKLKPHIHANATRKCHTRILIMRTVILTLVLLSLASFGLSLKCPICVDASCNGLSFEQQCPSAPGVTVACATYKNQGLLTKNCVTKTLCDGTLDLGFEDIKCCYSDMCNSSSKRSSSSRRNSSSRLGMSFAFVFCLVLLKLFL